MGALVMFGLVSVIAIVGVIYFNDQDKKGNDMGAIAVSIFVSVVAVVGYIYFSYQDRKEK
ncbi:hypothetical protein H6B28_17290 [Bacteroides mediterraneensis]|nr:hypothetical protein [Bacteroides mediterraneensis]